MRRRGRGVDVERVYASTSSDAEPYAQLQRAVSLHLRQVADLVELGRHDSARELFRFAMAISSELDCRSGRGAAAARSHPPRERSA
jgi:hypothetical protein